MLPSTDVRDAGRYDADLPVRSAGQRPPTPDPRAIRLAGARIDLRQAVQLATAPGQRVGRDGDEG
ncbi:hypothetical protein [Blastococcus sp. SYSU DS0973]